MALFHLATVSPTKSELIADWAPTQSWGPPVDAPIHVIGSYRFDDPDGRVGMETRIVTAGDLLLHVPLTYRDEPLDDADDAFIMEMQHSVLGTRWVYDGLGDPRFVIMLAAVTMTGQVTLGNRLRRAVVHRAQQRPHRRWGMDAGTGPGRSLRARHGRRHQVRASQRSVRAHRRVQHPEPGHPLPDGHVGRPARAPCCSPRLKSARPDRSAVPRRGRPAFGRRTGDELEDGFDESGRPVHRRTPRWTERPVGADQRVDDLRTVGAGGQLTAIDTTVEHGGEGDRDGWTTRFWKRSISSGWSSCSRSTAATIRSPCWSTHCRCISISATRSRQLTTTTIRVAAAGVDRSWPPRAHAWSGSAGRWSAWRHRQRRQPARWSWLRNRVPAVARSHRGSPRRWQWSGAGRAVAVLRLPVGSRLAP